jgi:hypothetical protein
MAKSERKKNSKVFKTIFLFLCIIIVLSAVWVAFSLIGRVNTAAVIPETAVFRLSIHNTVRFIDGVLTHESVQDISGVPVLAPLSSVLNELNVNPFFKKRFVRFAAQGKFEFALLPPKDKNEIIVAAYDLRFFTLLFRIITVFSGFIKIPNLYYVNAGKDSRFELRIADMTLFIGQYRNILYITNNFRNFETRTKNSHAVNMFKNIKPTDYDAAFLFSHLYIHDLFSKQDPRIEEILNSLEFESMVEAGVSIIPRKLEIYLAAHLSSDNTLLNRFLESRSQTPEMADRFPSSTQYATVLSAGTLGELYRAASVFGADFDDAVKLADNSSRAFLGLTLDELLYSWSGKEFSVFGIEGRPHPVFAVQVSDERKRQQVFDKAFRSVFLNEDTRLDLDGVRMPRIATPDFLQYLLKKWNIFLPSPYYTVYRDFLLISESADTLLSALRAMQRNDTLPGTAAWRNIAGGKSAASAFSLYYSLDLSTPFFLRKNTALSAFFTLYREGLVRMNFNGGLLELSLSFVPGSGSGITLVNGYPLDIGGRPSNQVFGAERGEYNRVFFASGNSAFSVNLADKTVYGIEGQGIHWVVPAKETGKKDEMNAWVVSDRGRVTLVNADMEPAERFPVLTGLRISASPCVFDGKLYLCGEDGRVCIIDEKGGQNFWNTSFTSALRSPPSFLNLSVKGGTRIYAAVYPKSFFGEIWLLDENGKNFPNWPVPTATTLREGGFADSGIGFGSPLVFAHNGKIYVAFVCQSGELILYDENASIVLPFPLSLNGIFYIQPVFDGEYLWLISADGTLFRIGINGELLYQNIPGLSVKEEGYIKVFDCNGDMKPEIFITGEANALYAYTRNFRSLEGFPLPVWGKPLFTEAGIRKAEIIGMGMDRRLYRWQFR